MSFFPQGVIVRWALAASTYFSNFPRRRSFLAIVAGITIGLLLLEYLTFTSRFPRWLFYNVLLAPWIEEVIYRGLIIDGLRNLRGAPLVPIVLSTGIFCLAHYLSGNLSLIQVGAGLLLGSIYWHWRSILYCAFFHGIGNLLLGVNYWWHGGHF